MLCTNTKLEKFSLDHFTYINQIFGDRGVRGIISDVFENPNYGFRVEKITKVDGEIQSTKYIDDEEDEDEDDENKDIDLHHILYKKNITDTKKRKPTIKNPLDNVCSYANKQQDNKINVNDTLCQSYSLLTYFNIEIDDSQEQRQKDMIDMYRNKILTDKKFIKNFNRLVKLNQGKQIWGIYDDDTGFPTRYIEMDTVKILEKLRDVLDDWENFGYWYFIGNGKCPRPTVEPRQMVSPSPMVRRSVATNSKPNTRLQNSNKKQKNIGGNNKTKSNKRTTKKR